MDLNQIDDVLITPIVRMGGSMMTFSQQNDKKNLRIGAPSKKKDSGCTTHTILNKIGDNSSLFHKNLVQENYNKNDKIHTPGN